jgi:hypothetical protein
VEQSQSMLLPFLVVSWMVITAILAVLVVYRITLSAKENNEIYINAAEHCARRDIVFAPAHQRRNLDLSGALEFLGLAGAAFLLAIIDDPYGNRYASFFPEPGTSVRQFASGVSGLRQGRTTLVRHEWAVETTLKVAWTGRSQWCSVLATI